MARSTYEALVLIFPSSREMFRKTKRKIEVYNRVLYLFLGDYFTFDFHVEMFKVVEIFQLANCQELFGENEAKELLKEERRAHLEKHSYDSSILFAEPSTTIIDEDITVAKRKSKQRFKSAPRPYALS